MHMINTVTLQQSSPSEPTMIMILRAAFQLQPHTVPLKGILQYAKGMQPVLNTFAAKQICGARR